MEKLLAQIEDIWQNKDIISKNPEDLIAAKQIIKIVIDNLDTGIFKICDKINGEWQINEWLKKTILLSFKFMPNIILSSGAINWYDKVLPKFGSNMDEDEFKKLGIRAVPGAYVRKGAYIGKNVILMPSFVNIGAYVDDSTLIDTWATVGSCARIGKNCHISGGVGIGGVLEPLQAKPVIIEDNCFIGARSQIAEGVLIEEGAVIAMGTYIGASTKIIDRDTGTIYKGKVPAYSVVVPGSYNSDDSKIALQCAVIVKKVDQKTLNKVSINEILREAEV